LPSKMKMTMNLILKTMQTNNNLEKADSIGFAEIQNFLEKLNSANYSLQEIKVGLQKWDKVIYSMNIQNEINRINDIQTKIILLHEKIKNVA
jgi:hypothetical protein